MNKRTGIALTAALLAASLASASAFADSPESALDKSGPGSQPNLPITAQADELLEPAAAQSAPAAAAPARSAPPSTKRVYLDDYQKLNQPVTRPISTEMVVLGQRKRPN